MNADEMFQVAVEIKKECGPHPELEVLVDEVANAYRRALEAEKAGLQGRAEQGARPEATPTSRQ